MYNKKVCILGARAVGKTSLIKRFLGDEFSEGYSATVGAEIKKFEADVDREKVRVMLWDIQGEDWATEGFTNYLKGASAIIYVVDGTRLQTLDSALELKLIAETRIDNAVPSIMLFNKSDLAKRWEISPSTINNVESNGIFSILTSSREGTGVNMAFNLITRVMLGKSSMIAA